MLWSIYKTALTKFGMLVQILTMLDILTLLSHYLLQYVMKKYLTVINVLIT